MSAEVVGVPRFDGEAGRGAVVIDVGCGVVACGATTFGRFVSGSAQAPRKAANPVN